MHNLTRLTFLFSYCDESVTLRWAKAEPIFRVWIRSILLENWISPLFGRRRGTRLFTTSKIKHFLLFFGGIVVENKWRAMWAAFWKCGSLVEMEGATAALCSTARADCCYSFTWTRTFVFHSHIEREGHSPAHWRKFSMLPSYCSFT